MDNKTHSMESVDLAKMSDDALFKLSRSIHNQIAYAIRQKLDDEEVKKLQVDACYISRELALRKENSKTHRK